MNNAGDRTPYLLIFQSPEEEPPRREGDLPDEFAVWMAWIDDLKTKGLSLGGRPLEHEGRVLKPQGRAAADGPFAEGKEIVGGYLIVLARDLDEACRIGSGCPGLRADISVEVRRLMKVPDQYAHVLL